MPIVLKSGSLNLQKLSGSVQACHWIALPFYYYFKGNVSDKPYRKIKNQNTHFILSKFFTKQCGGIWQVTRENNTWPRKLRFSWIQTQTDNIVYLFYHNIIIPSDFVKYFEATLTKLRNYQQNISCCNLFRQILPLKKAMNNRTCSCCNAVSGTLHGDPRILYCCRRYKFPVVVQRSIFLYSWHWHVSLQ
jgi:hypothetical protein